MHDLSPILLLIVQVGLILALSRVMGLLFARFHQPQVMGEMIAGIMLGPSLFGLVAHGAWLSIFPSASVPLLNILSQVGVIFFLFLIGLELDPKLLRNRGHAAVVISHASIIAPFLLGAGLTLFLYPRVFNADPHMRFTSVALFMGASMSITAFPVLARILTERNLHKGKVGAVAIACAAIDDVTAWCMLAFVVGVARAAGIKSGLMTAAGALIYVAVMFLVVRPFLRRLEQVFERSGRLSQNMLAIILLLVLASAFTTEKIGIHALFGAFLMGAIMPKNSRFVSTVMEKLEDYTVVFFLPIFFAYTGLRTEIGVLNNGSLWFYTFLIIAAACIGKFGGSAIAARAAGLGWREASAIGTLMNTRGLMELVILNIGRDLGVITTAVFAMMVIMAIVTTALTTPVLHWVYPAALLEGAPDEKARKKFSVLIPISLPTSGPSLLNLASVLRQGAVLPNVIALYLRRPVERDLFRTGLDEPAAEKVEALQPLLAAAAEKEIHVEPLTFVSRDVPSDIARVARMRSADLILMGFHKPVFGQAILGGTVHRVLTGSDADVAVFVDRGFLPGSNILVPYLGGRHDRLALDLAGRISRHTKASLTVLHVVPPDRTDKDETLHAQSNVQKAFADPSTQTQVEFKIIHSAFPVDAVVEQARNYPLVVIGVEEEWGLESHLFGWRPERLAREVPGSILVVRKRSRIPVPRQEPEIAVPEKSVEEPATALEPAAESEPVTGTEPSTKEPVLAGAVAAPTTSEAASAIESATPIPMVAPTDAPGPLSTGLPSPKSPLPTSSTDIPAIVP
jgi:Kef-type K+ transport system membrane component KefB